MIDQLEMIDELSDYPFLLFQERICIYDSDFQNYDLIQRFSEQYWEEIPEETVNFHVLEDLVFAAVKFSVTNQTYLFSFVFKKEMMTSWSDIQLSKLLNRTQAIITILSKTITLTFSEPSSLKELFPRIEAMPLPLKPRHFEEEVDFSDNYDFEKALIHQLKKGNVASFEKMISKLSSINSTQLSNNKVVELKYRIVALIALITRSTIDYGCNPSLAFRLSDQLIRRMDLLQKTTDFSEFTKQMMTEFSLLMQTESIPRTSLVVRRAAQYINQNLYEPLSLEIVAEMVDVHPSYLSTTFKKTMSLSFSQYMNKARIEEAKYLLTQTDKSYAQISDMLHFSSQSYFGCIFKQLTGFTPKEYKIAH